MTRLSVKDLRAGTQLDKAPFLLAVMQQATDRNGDSYLKLTLRDKTGDIEARYWRVPAEVVQTLAEGQGVAVSGHVAEYRSTTQINLSAICACPLENMADFMPIARRSHEDMVDELQRLVKSIKNSHLRELLKEVLGEATFQERFFQAPAAKNYHHACVGGLLEHSLDVARHVIFCCSRYPEIDRDLAATAALLHDVGKVDSYVQRGTFDFTDDGRLLSHVYIGAALVERAIERIEGFPAELRLRILHAILAHHGMLEKGSPVTPRTPEAIVIHYADSLDAALRGWVDHVNRESPNGGTTWTLWSNMHEGELYVGNTHGSDD